MITAEAIQMKVIEDVTFKDAPNQIRKLNIPLTRHVRIVVHDLEEPKRSALKTLHELQQEASSKPKPTREELRELLECDAEEVNELFGDEYFDQ